MDIRNIAIVAHVDHGKTTLVDGLFRQSQTISDRDFTYERIMDSGDIEKERGITITAKNCAINWKNVKINLVDTPGHSDFGGEVERSLSMVDGILLLVDAAEGPLPQTRFVLSKAMQLRLKPLVIINKMDRSDARAEEVEREIEDLFLELAEAFSIHDFDLHIPMLYASGRDGWASLSKNEKGTNLTSLLDFIVDYFPAPKVVVDGPFQLLVSNLSHSTYLGAQAIGRIQRGVLKEYDILSLLRDDNRKSTVRAVKILVFDGPVQKDTTQAQAGEIVIVSGVEGAQIGDTITDPTCEERLPRITVEPPTVGVHVSVNTSPFSGKDGDYMTSRKLEEFLIEACRKNVALQYEITDDPKVFLFKGRGEFQLSIVFEEWRRRDCEFMVGRPQVLMKEIDGQLLEPFERLVLDVPADCVGIITEKLSVRKGALKKIIPFGPERNRLEFLIPSRGLIGYRGTFLTDTRGAGLMSSIFDSYKPFIGKMLARIQGALIADRTGRVTAYALNGLLGNGRQFVRPGDTVYEGMIVGEHSKANDLNINPAREKHVSNVRNKNKDENIVLPFVPVMSLEFALAWIDDDEFVEVTPKNIRLRKKILTSNQRTVIRG
jgi:GTP-binding protein